MERPSAQLTVGVVLNMRLFNYCYDPEQKTHCMPVKLDWYIPQ